jgi:hypothetical protein
MLLKHLLPVSVWFHGVYSSEGVLASAPPRRSYSPCPVTLWQHDRYGEQDSTLMTLLVAQTGNTTVRVCKVGKVQTWGRDIGWVDGWFELLFFLNVNTNRSNTIVPVQWFSLLNVPTIPHSIVGTQAAVCCHLLASSVRASKCWESGRQPTSTALTTPSTQPVQLYNRKDEQSFTRSVS